MQLPEQKTPPQPAQGSTGADGGAVTRTRHTFDTHRHSSLAVWCPLAEAKLKPAQSPSWLHDLVQMVPFTAGMSHW